MSLDDWTCNHCGVGLDDDCIRLPDPREASYCYDCAKGIALAFQASPEGASELPRSPSNHDREILERLEAVEALTQRVKNVWVLWLNDAQKGAINPGTFHTMKHLLGIDQA